MEESYDDLDEDIERLNIILQDEPGGADSDGELRVLEDGKLIIKYRKAQEYKIFAI